MIFNLPQFTEESRSLQHLNTKRVVNCKKKPSFNEGFLKFPATTYSPTLVSRVVPLALQGLTAEFEMGSGVTPVL